MRWTYILCILAAGVIAEESFERVRRAPGKRCPRIQNFSGKIKYKRRGTRAQFRCQKTFIRYGNRAVNCRSDNTWSGEPPICIKAGCVPIDIQHLDKLDMTEQYGGALLSFRCEDEYQLIGATEIYCDSTVWSSMAPVCKAPTQLTECDFEDDLCGWTQDDSDDLDWTRNQGQTSTGGTGPKTDHTLQSISGHYMFVESSNPARYGNQARLLSPVYPSDMADMCFDFWYHLLGPDDTGHVGTLEVFVRGDSEFIDDLQPVFIKGGNQGDVWKRGDIYIDKRDEPYQIVIVITRKLSYISDIAIDDVRLYNCTGTTTTTTTTVTTPSESSPTTTTSTTSATLSTTLSASSSQSSTTESIPSTAAKETPSKTSSTTGINSLSTTTPTSSFPSSSFNVSTSAKTSSQGTTTLIPPSVSSKMASTPSTKSTVQSSTMSTTPLSSSTSALTGTPKASSAATASSSRTKSTTQTSTTQGSSSVTIPSTSTGEVTTTFSVPTETTNISRISSARTTQPPVTSSPTTGSTKVSQTSNSSLTPTPSTTITTTIKASTTTTVQPTSSSVSTSTETTEKQTSTSSIKTSTTASTRVQTETTTTSLTKQTTLPTTSITISSTNPASTQTTKTDTTSQPTTTTTSKSTPASLSTSVKLKRTSTTTSTPPSEPTTEPITIKTGKAKTTKAILNRTMSTNTVTSAIKLNKTVTTENKSTPAAGGNGTEPVVVVAQQRSQHPADETLRPLMIGLGVGIVAGLIIIGVVAWVCVRRRKFYTSRYEDELKPITKSSSNENFNNIQYEYHDDEEYQ